MSTAASLRRSDLALGICVLLLFAPVLRAGDAPLCHLAFDTPSDAGELVEGKVGKALSLTGDTFAFDTKDNFNPARGTINLQLLDLDFNGQFAGQQRNVLRVRTSDYYLQVFTQNRYVYWRMYVKSETFAVKGQPFDSLYRVMLSGPGLFNPGEWCNIVASWDVEQRTLRLAVNGVESTPVTFDLIEGVNPMQTLVDKPPTDGDIGSNGDSLFVIDELKVFDAVRDDLFHPVGGERDDATKHGSRVGRDWKPSLEVESPHIPWLKPNASGKLNVLVVQPWENLRESVELAQRLDCELDVIPVTSFSRRCDGDEKMHPYEHEDFIAKVKTSDVIVLAGIPPQWFDDESWAALLAAMDEGKGVVWPIAKMFDHPRIAELVKHKVDTPAYARRGVPYDNLIVWHEPDKSFTFIEQGGGRMVLCDAAGHLFTRYSSMTPIYYTNDGEMYYALLSRLAVWTARREPAVNVEVMRNLGFDAGKPQNWAEQKVTIAVPPSAAGSAARIDLTVRDVTDTWAFREGRYTKPGLRHVGESTYKTVHHTTQAVTLAEGTMELTCSFAPLPCGRYTLDAQLFDAEGRAIDWDSALVLVEAQPRMMEVTPTARAFAPGTTASIAHTFRHVSAADDVTLRWRIVDVHDRVIAVGAEPWNGTEAQTVSFTMPDNFTKGVYYEVTTYRGDEPLQTMRAMMLIPRLREKAFYYAVYGALRERLGDLGVDALFGSDERSDAALVEYDADVVYWINAPGLTIEQQPGDTVRSPSLSSAAWGSSVDAFMAKYAASFAAHRPIAGVVVDEWEYAPYNFAKPYHDMDHDPESVAAFRAFLREEYDDSLGALNETWGENYATWDDVDMKLNKDVDHAANPAPSVDRMRFIDSVVADAFAYINDAARQYDPAARLGLSGTRPPKGFNGYDYYKIVTGRADAIINYSGPMPALSRSFAGPGDFTATWEGYGSNRRPTAGAQVWRAFIVGHDAYINYTTFPSYSLHAVDWTLNGGAAPRREVYRELDSGIAQLVRGGTRGRDAFAIHYAQAGIHLLPLNVAGVNEKTFTANLDSLIQLLEDAGLEPRFVATEQIAAGQLDELGVKVLYLPLSTAIGDDEARELEAFVRNGGTIIADAVCGLRDRHGRRRDKGALDHLFGIEREGEAKYIDKLGRLNGETNAIIGEWHIKATGAGGSLTLGKDGPAPALIENQVGRGRAVLLNFTFADYNVVQPGGVGGEVAMITRAKAERRAEVQQQFRGMLEQSSIHPAVRVDATPNEKGLRLETLTAHYTDGNALYALVQANQVDAFNLEDRATNAATIHLPKRGHVYDVRRGDYLGDTDHVNVTLIEGDAHVLAVLPSKPSSLQINLDRARIAAGQPLRFSMNLDAPVRHVTRITVIGPDGQPRPGYTRNVEGEGVLPLALNDPPGAWRIDARDVATGLTATAVFHVQ